MKKLSVVCKKTLCVFMAVCIILCVPYIFSACIDNNTYNGELLRLHIRANSNSEGDQSVKLKVRDAVNSFIEKNIHKSTFDEAYREIGKNIDALGDIATNVLASHGFKYTARARLTNEYFPSRMYKDVVVPEGYYDALIIELGAAEGDNWWCVVYPPLCYGEDFKYKSFFAELFG